VRRLGSRAMTCGEYSHHGKRYKKRKKNFLEELFD
jgi:Zn-finger nucleic acid-binding protein